ncbi:peroxiredoxin family protein [Oceanobacillus iheyensis]|uniref:Cytochrome c biogenesis (Thiol:disulfide interchange protein) n=1 Tax=Oceanobacillus iheyensis (strain DSM 14371 / CIP 107618 / JCM 11309 / KCTC 3954 / HTE831) TaxID=221109 RepID=Q8CVA5_OCEIH|nr:TlpA disulfide reductase family protein [Oceanobacillus iheyensis]BAC12808.1 cytochrome c biogenesis (thiol:disulfide interchange protein) [Oceanobacillus iheyensis HTE831]
MKILKYVLIISISMFLPIMTAYAEGTEVGERAPDFELKTIDGQQLRLSDFKGERVLINFWTTWCPPCRQEMPDMQRFYQDLQPNILAVNLTDTEMNKEQVVRFSQELELTFPILLDEKGEVSKAYRISPIPTTYMIDSEGIIRHKSYGALTYEQMVAEYNKME